MEFLDNVTAVNGEMTDAEFRKAILQLLAEQTILKQAGANLVLYYKAWLSTVSKKSSTRWLK